MFTILLFTILGFLSGLVFVMVKRKIKPGAILGGTLLSLLSLGIMKVLRDYSRRKGRRYF
jgi:hypothetical protein